MTDSTAHLNYPHSAHEMLSHIRKYGPQLLGRLQSGTGHHFDLVWTAHPRWPLPPGDNLHPRTVARISVLDSSFNPPTLAHLALLNTKRPSYACEASEGPGRDYDAKLLLLSVKNADKTLKPNDATYLQRLEMMALLAQDVATCQNLEDGRGNVAVGIIDEPTFIGKSRILKEYFDIRVSSLQQPPPNLLSTDSNGPGDVAVSPKSQLTFLVGMDTLKRILSPKYYSPPPDLPDLTPEQTMSGALSRMLSESPKGDDSLIVCARRSTLPSDTTSQQSKGESDLQQALEPAYRMGWLKLDGDESTETSKETSLTSYDERWEVLDYERITLIDIGDRESQFSSTAIRNALGRTAGN
ncbi:hypothetical protein FA15DRAFT_613355, partial [Coprinopsis marcescibilis]